MMPDCWHFVGSMKALRRFFFQGASKFTDRIRKTFYTYTKKNENKYIQMLSSCFGIVRLRSTQFFEFEIGTNLFSLGPFAF